MEKERGIRDLLNSGKLTVKKARSLTLDQLDILAKLKIIKDQAFRRIKEADTDEMSLDKLNKVAENRKDWDIVDAVDVFLWNHIPNYQTLWNETIEKSLVKQILANASHEFTFSQAHVWITTDEDKLKTLFSKLSSDGALSGRDDQKEFISFAKDHVRRTFESAVEKMIQIMEIAVTLNESVEIIVARDRSGVVEPITAPKACIDTIVAATAPPVADTNRKKRKFYQDQRLFAPPETLRRIDYQPREEGNHLSTISGNPNCS